MKITLAARDFKVVPPNNHAAFDAITIELKNHRRVKHLIKMLNANYVHPFHKIRLANTSFNGLVTEIHTSANPGCALRITVVFRAFGELKTG